MLYNIVSFWELIFFYKISEVNMLPKHIPIIMNWSSKKDFLIQVPDTFKV
jgi:hypothetical protein